MFWSLKIFHLPWGLALSKFALIWFDFGNWKAQSDLTASEVCVVLPRPPAYHEIKLFPHSNLNFEVEIDKVVNGIDQFVNEFWDEFLIDNWVTERPTNFWTFSNNITAHAQICMIRLKSFVHSNKKKIRKEHSLKQSKNCAILTSILWCMARVIPRNLSHL